MEGLSAQASTFNSGEEAIWDWEIISLVLAVAACLMFFIGTALISVNYIRQWRRIKKEFDTGESRRKFLNEVWRFLVERFMLI